MPTILNKAVARKLIDELPENASWDDLIYQIYARQVIEQGLRDSDLDNTRDVKDIRKKYGLP